MWAAWIQVLIFVLAAVLVNGLLYFVGWRFKMARNMIGWCRSSLIPPGYFIAVVWVVLFGLLGYAHYLTYKEGDSGNGGFTTASIVILVVAAFCLLYTWAVYKFPMYSKFFNVVSLIMAFTLGILVLQESEEAFWFVLPLIVWSAYINIADSLVLCESTISAIEKMI